MMDVRIMLMNRRNRTTYLIVSVILLSLYILVTRHQVIRSSTTSTIEEYYNYYYSSLDHPSYRIRLWYHGRCMDIGPSSGRLEVDWCDPDQTQSFQHRPDGKLVYDKTGECLAGEDGVMGINTTFILKDCDVATDMFKVISESYIVPIGDGDEMCLTPTLKNGSSTREPCLQDQIQLRKCEDPESKIILLEEKWFLNDRKLLKNVAMPTDMKSCNFKACAFNRPREPIIYHLPDFVNRCTDLSKCLTVAVKTARRPHLILRLAETIRDIVGYDLPIAAFDDGPQSDNYTRHFEALFSDYPLIDYKVGERNDYGIGWGRDLAIAMVKTKYLLLMDDDEIFIPETDVKMMVEVLDTTDVSLVGGEVRPSNNYGGFLKFGNFNGNKRQLGLFPMSCRRANLTLTGFPTCVRCELTTNVFIARTADILEVGGWDPELMVREHIELFIRMKGAGKKVVQCPYSLVGHRHPHGDEDKGEGYGEKRHRGGKRFLMLIKNRYNINNFFTDGNPQWVGKDGKIGLEARKERGSC